MTPYEFYSNVELFKHSQNKSDELAHYGTKGQKWGQRHWQNYDGTFNQAGKERYFGTGKSKNGVSDYLKFKKTATDEPAKEFGDFPGVKGLKRAFNNLKKFEFGSTDQPANEFSSIFNKKNVSYNDPKYNPYIDEENKMWDNVKEQQSKNWAKDKELINDLAGKELKYYDEDPILLEYYSNIKADIANEMKEKYPSIEPRTFRMNALHAENEPFVSGYDGQEELREQYKDLHEKAKKYPPRSAKRVKLEGEAALINAKEELNQKKIEEELNENVEKYIKENKNNILQDIDRIRGKIKEIDIADDYGDYYVTRALEEHNKKKYNNFNEKGLKDLSDDEWDDIKNIAKAEYEDDISMQNKWNNNQKFGSTEKPAKEFGSHTENNDISDKANEIYKKYKPNEWRRILNTSDLSTEDAIKIENELNKKLYKEDKNYAKIVNDENVKNALQEYIDSWNDVIKESNRIYSKEFMDKNPEAKDWDGDGTEYWYKFADKDISNRDTDTYWKLREAVSSLSHKHGKWDNDMLNKVLSDLTEPVNDTTDESSKAYDKIKERTGIDFREPSQKFGSTNNPFERKMDKDYGWWYFNKAVQDLGLTNVSYKDLTNADWDKINAKVSELSK